MDRSSAIQPHRALWRIAPADLVDVFVYVTVLNLAVEYFPMVVT